MDRIPLKTSPKFFDLAVKPLQEKLADSFSWLDYSIGICEILTNVKEGKRFTSANLYKGEGQYEQIMPCEELGNFSFFVLRDPQVPARNFSTRITAPYSLIIWYNLDTIGSPVDERNRERVKAQILATLDSVRSTPFSIDRIYERPQNIFADFSYDHTANQFLMAPYAGLRIDGNITAKLPCEAEFLGSYDESYDDSYDK